MRKRVRHSEGTPEYEKGQKRNGCWLLGMQSEKEFIGDIVSCQEPGCLSPFFLLFLSYHLLSSTRLDGREE